MSALPERIPLPPERASAEGRAGARRESVPGRIVYKFGGSSVAAAQRIREVARLVGAARSRPMVVVSALGGVTDRLVAIAESIRDKSNLWRELVPELETRHTNAAIELTRGDADARRVLEAELAAEFRRIEEASRRSWDAAAADLWDHVTSLGEDLSARLTTLALRAEGVFADFVDARDVVRTDDLFGRARPLTEEVARLARARLVPPRPGNGAGAPGIRGCHFRRTHHHARPGRVRLFGRDLGRRPRRRGGPHLDRHGRDPHRGSARGRQPAHPARDRVRGGGRALPLRRQGDPSWRGQVRGRIGRAAPDPEHVPTVRPGHAHPARPARGAEITAIASKQGAVLIKVRSLPTALPYGFLARVFDVLARHQLPVDLVATSHSSTAFTIDRHEELRAMAEELSEFAEVDVRDGLATVTVVGHGLMEEPGVDARVFWEVSRTPVHLISQASDVSLSFLVDEERAPDLVRRLHTGLIELRDEEGRARLQ